MAIVISGVNNTDKITATDGTIDLLSGVNYSSEVEVPSLKVGNNIQLGNAGIVTATSFAGNISGTTGTFGDFVNVGSNIQLGNAGVVTATTFTGNLTGNVNATSNLLFQIGGSEQARIDSNGRLLVNTTTTYVSNQIMIVKGSSPSGGNAPYDGQIAIEGSETNGAQDTGGVLAFIGHSGAGSRGFGSIRNLKEDGTSGNFGSYMSFHTRTNGSAPAEKLRINSTGQIITNGNATPYPTRSATFQPPTGQTNCYVSIVAGNTTSTSGLTFGDSAAAAAGNYAGMFEYNHNTDTLAYMRNGSNRISVDSDGAVNVGVNPAQATGTNTQNAILTIKGYPGGETSAAILALVRGNNTTSTAANHTMGRIVFADKQAGEYAFIEGEAEANGAVGDTPGRLSFSTAPDGTSAPTEKLRISSEGYVTKPNHPSFCARHQDGSGFSGNIIVLTRISNSWDVWNIGGHYSTSTGKFTVPVAGVYYFEGQLMTTGHSNGDNIQDMFSLESNRGRITYVRQRESYFSTVTNANGYYTNSLGSPAQLAAGDTVWLQRSGSQSWGYSNRYYSYFTGWLIG
jgi:hypothetical protein